MFVSLYRYATAVHLARGALSVRSRCPLYRMRFSVRTSYGLDDELSRVDERVLHFQKLERTRYPVSNQGPGFVGDDLEGERLIPARNSRDIDIPIDVCGRRLATLNLN